MIERVGRAAAFKNEIIGFNPDLRKRRRISGKNTVDTGGICRKDKQKKEKQL